MLLYMFILLKKYFELVMVSCFRLY